MRPAPLHARSLLPNIAAASRDGSPNRAAACGSSARADPGIHTAFYESKTKPATPRSPAPEK